ncbi:hypothetical protein FC84_GL001587 [Lapidilactobacillus dextrinicus DSM 20335]|uniref:Baseplate upper protein immunoglobulin like domain-containing protein n=1 Tax=Lapidilactobacillus dextrinicus DSM 20335 TaxID=1423738 RepID=A0A0R2BV70_9LACO|nr:hypothetical protein [Lapidilactobacillus dextrinicus]KRM79411.1 hypothetical protein FC84_GL001587 [Lapidilactobacillus dextrinicus DSM 20335]QFG46756.1 hypothetical protein LH506_04530 [Lapidilactobacillus dextrinicus]
MKYKVYQDDVLKATVTDKKFDVVGLQPNTEYKLSVQPNNGLRDGVKQDIIVKTHSTSSIRFVIPKELAVGSTIPLRYVEYPLGLVPIGKEPAGMFGGGNEKELSAKVIDSDSEIIGRNYLLNTSLPTSSDKVHVGTASTSIYGNLSYSDGITRVTFTSGSELFYRFMSTDTTNMAKTELVAGQTYTLSADVRTDLKGGRLTWRSQHIKAGGGWSDFQTGGAVTITETLSDNVFKRINTTFTIPENTTGLFFSFQLYGSSGKPTIGSWFEFKHAKLELSDKATDWSPALEDNGVFSIAEVEADTEIISSIDFLNGSTLALQPDGNYGLTNGFVGIYSDGF